MAADRTTGCLSRSGPSFEQCSDRVGAFDRTYSNSANLDDKSFLTHEFHRGQYSLQDLLFLLRADGFLVVRRLPAPAERTVRVKNKVVVFLSAAELNPEL